MAENRISQYNLKNLALLQINGIYHMPRMQTEKSQPKGKRIMQETRCTSFLALSIDPRVGISLSAMGTDD